MVSIELVAKGGKTLFTNEEYLSSDAAAYYMIESGFANLNGIQLKNFLQKKDCFLSAGIFPNMRSIKAKGPVNEGEVLLKAIRALFLEKHFDSGIWTNLMEQIKEVEKYKDNMPIYFFIEEVNHILYADHPFYVSGKASDANEEIAKRCAEIAFQDPSEFSVVIVGDFDLAAMQNLICSYFHFRESDKSEKRSIQLPILSDLSESIDKVIYKGKETHGVTTMAYRKMCGEKAISDLSMRALTHILTERAFKKMRRELGDTYSVYFSYEFPLDPFRGNLNVYINFSSLPEKAENLKNEAEEVILEFMKNGPSDDEVNVAKKIIEQKVKENLMLDEFWEKLHTDAILYRISAEDILRDKKELEMITKENLHALAKEIFEDTPVIKMSLFPEK
jgi:zinc protease